MNAAERPVRCPRAVLLVLLSSTIAALVAAASVAEAQIADVGLSSVRAQRFGRLDLPNANAGGDDRFAFAFAVGDFDNDGADDLATGVPRSDGPAAAPVDQCGQVVVRYGIPVRGLDEGSAPTVLGQFVAGSSNSANAADRFGFALVACDLNGDDFDDLAVGVPYETYTIGGLFTITEGGVVEVYYGSPAGLVPPATTRIREAPLALEIPASGARFGLALGCGDFDDDGDDDLAVGMPARDLPGEPDTGRINVFPGSPSGPGAGAYPLDQDTAGIGDQPETGDMFGTALAAGDFDGDGFADLAIGVPGETIGVNYGEGAVHVLFGALKGLGTGGDQIFYNPLYNLDANGFFGTALAVGNFDADPHDDLAIGSPKDDMFAQDAGVVIVLSGSSSGLDLANYQGLAPDTLLGDGESQFDERFGSAVAAGDFDGDGADDLAVGSPYEDVGGQDDGAITIAMGAAGAGLHQSPGHARQFDHGLEGIPGDPDEHFVRWGLALASGDFDGDQHSDLAIGAPLESESLLNSVGAEAILYGALFADGFESGGGGAWSNVAP